ncbi:unnamed protein product, partial [Choristocarpus tenellus]
MAGRGRGMTLPAWMTKEGGGGPLMDAGAHMPGGLNGGTPGQDHHGNGAGYNGMVPAPGQFSDPTPQHGYVPPPQQQSAPPPPQEYGDRGSRRRRSPSPRGGHRDRDRD